MNLIRIRSIRLTEMRRSFINIKNTCLLLFRILSSSGWKLVSPAFLVLHQRANLLKYCEVCQGVEVWMVEHAITFDTFKG